MLKGQFRDYILRDSVVLFDSFCLRRCHALSIYLTADKANFNFSSFGPGSFVNMLYTAPTHPSRLSMNFMCGTDNVFHVNPRYDDRVSTGGLILLQRSGLNFFL